MYTLFIERKTSQPHFGTSLLFYVLRTSYPFFHGNLPSASKFSQDNSFVFDVPKLWFRHVRHLHSFGNYKGVTLALPLPLVRFMRSRSCSNTIPIIFLIFEFHIWFKRLAVSSTLALLFPSIVLALQWNSPSIGQLGSLFTTPNVWF